MSLPFKNTRSTYGLASISLHWIMALTIIGLYILGLYIDTLDYYDPNYRTFPHWHKSIGIILLGFYVCRLVWNLINPHPEPLPQPPMAQLATKVVHKLMYVLIILVLISGYLISTADGRAIAVFNWFEIPAIPAIIERQEDTAGFLHYWLATGLISLAGLHALAALKHHFINKDQTLNRMLGKAQSTQE